LYNDDMTRTYPATLRVFAVLIISAFLTTFLFFEAHAQEQDNIDYAQSDAADGSAPQGTPPNGPSLPSRSIPDELDSCFDYYRFGSVPVSLSGKLHEVMQGATMGLVGSIENQNNYELRDVDVILKVFKKSDTVGKNPNGPDVVDEIVPIQGLTLKAHETLPIRVTYSVPVTLEPGEYQVASFVTSENRFNLSGLSFTDDIIGSV